MNQGEIVNNMRHILGKIEDQTRSSLNIDTMEIRKLSTQLQDEANYLWNWAMAAEDGMPLGEWRVMYAKHKEEK